MGIPIATTISRGRTNVQKFILRLKMFFAFTILIFGIAVSASNKCNNVFILKDMNLSEVGYNIAHGHKFVSDSDIFGRILRGKNDLDFTKLSNDKGRHIVLLMDSTGLESTFSNTNTTPPLERIGYTREYIKQLKQSGTKFKLALIKQKSAVLPATWDNLLPFLEKTYGENHVVVILHKFYLNSLKKFSFSEILKDSMHGIDPGVTSTSLSIRSTLLEYRSFLYNELRLTELFTGLGFTITPDGYKGLAEYFTLNQEFSSLDPDSVEIVDLPF